MHCVILIIWFAKRLFVDNSPTHAAVFVGKGALGGMCVLPRPVIGCTHSYESRTRGRNVRYNLSLVGCFYANHCLLSWYAHYRFNSLKSIQVVRLPLRSIWLFS